MKLSILALLFVSLCQPVGLFGDEKQAAEIARLKERVSRLEAELKAMRQEFAALHTALKSSAAKLSQAPPTAKPLKTKSLNIEVLDGEWNGSSPRDIQKVCASAAQELWRHFPGQSVESISIRYSTKGPMVIYGTGTKGERRVLLNSRGTYWAQFAFQFAHEFCHIMCNYREANNPNLWFEESLCETASLFALRQMGKTWQTNPPYSNWKSYASALDDYAANRIKATTKLNGTTLAKWYRQNESALRKNATDRDKNQVVATAVLSLIEKQPRHWLAIRYLNQWDKTQALSFEAYLLDWYRRVPDEHKPFVVDVAKLFEISVK